MHSPAITALSANSHFHLYSSLTSHPPSPSPTLTLPAPFQYCRHRSEWRQPLPALFLHHPRGAPGQHREQRHRGERGKRDRHPRDTRLCRWGWGCGVGVEWVLGGRPAAGQRSAGSATDSASTPPRLPAGGGRQQRLGIWSIQWSGDSREIVAGTSDPGLRIYDMMQVGSTAGGQAVHRRMQGRAGGLGEWAGGGRWAVGQ